MTSVFKSLQKYAVLRSIAFIFLGIYVMLKPAEATDIILYLIIAYNILMGVINLISGFRHKVDGYNPTIGIAVFYFIAALLIFLLTKPLFHMIVILMGIAFIINGSMRIVQSFNLRQYVNVNWLPMLIYGVFLIGTGIFLVLNSSSTTLFFFRTFGILITISGISELIAFIRLRNMENN